ncbi:ABC transporter substrate-binding protein [Streptomyces sediminimaris]|uniref:ABC transporter substrate-binding protein n=1 Tax=Streptomyces sediminimaris TaxID=3383721 RepID=UPI00399A467B
MSVMAHQERPARRDETYANGEGPARAGAAAVRIGVLVPLTRPGWAEAGRHLLAGAELAAREVDDAGGIAGRPLELVVRDTAADPRRAAAAVDELARLGVAAVAGEYHSVVARAAAARADALGLPFLCSSAVLDTLTDQPAERVARLAPAQSVIGAAFTGCAVPRHSAAREGRAGCREPSCTRPASRVRPAAGSR